MTAILTPPQPEILLPWFYPSAETEAERQRILRGRWFLVRTAGLGMPWRCSAKKGGCGGVHDYLTLRCVPRPFSGLSRGLFALWQAAGAYGAERHLTPAERSRWREMDRMFAPVAGLPDLASSHPQTARSLKIDERDADMGAYSFVAPEPSSTALGIVEPLDWATAARYARRINLRGITPRFVLEGLEED